MPKCPKCNTDMREEVHPDLTIDRCDNCGGTFFDKGELDKITTARKYSIEAAPDKISDTHFSCPRCHVDMELVTLCLIDKVEIEKCPKCHGLFLDNQEELLINAKLREERKRKLDDQFRQYWENNLVTIKTETDAIPTGSRSMQARIEESVIATVYYQKELGINLVATNMNKIDKIKKALGISGAITLSQTTDYMASHFIIKSSDKLRVQKAFTHDVQKRIEAIQKGSHKIYTSKGKISIFDNGIVYREGPYPQRMLREPVAKAQAVLQELLLIAKQIDR